MSWGRQGVEVEMEVGQPAKAPLGGGREETGWQATSRQREMQHEMSQSSSAGLANRKSLYRGQYSRSWVVS